MRQLGIDLVLLSFGLLGCERNSRLQAMSLLKTTGHIRIVSWTRTLPKFLKTVFSEKGTAHSDRLVRIFAAVAYCAAHSTYTRPKWIIISWSRFIIAKSTILLYTCFFPLGYFVGGSGSFYSWTLIFISACTW